MLYVANANILNIYVQEGVANALSQKVNTATAINANGSITVPVPAGRTITFEQQGTKTGTTSATLFGELTGARNTITITVS